MTSSTKAPAAQSIPCPTEADAWAAIDEHLEFLIAAGLVIDTGWPGEPAMVAPLPHGPEVIYDRAKVEHVIKTLNTFEHIKGRWAGHPLKLFDWQVRWEIAPVFGLVTEVIDTTLDGEAVTRRLRIIRTAWFEKPRKNGKSTECSGLGLILAFADGEAGAEVYAAARNKDQARIVFAPAKTMAERNGALRKKLGRGIQRNLLENPSTTSIFRPLAADLGGSLHGLNVHGGIVDEVHVHTTPDTIDAIETGTGSREQPLVVFITTADEGKTGSIYDTKRTYLENLVAGTVEDPTWYGVVFAATDEMLAEAPFADETLIAANPGIGYTVGLDYLRAKAREASSSPAQLNRYLRLHLGKRTKQSIKWLDMARWDAAVGMAPTADDWKDAVVYAGLDLSATTDFTAAAILAVDPRDEDAYIGDLLVWIPEERVDDLERLTAVPLRQWHREGFVKFTEGNVVDYHRIRADIEARVAELGVTVSEIGYDPWNAAETVQKLERRFTMVPLRQGYGTLSNPSKELERLVMGSTPERPLFRFGFNPVLRWMVDCAEVMQDPAGNIKPTKPDRRASAKRIDGVAAIVNALARAMLKTKRRRRSGGGTS